MMVNANISQEVYDYFKGYDLSDIAILLLEQYDFTTLPQMSGTREKEVRLNITDPVYIQLYKTVGPRSKSVSLGRLLEFGYHMDVLTIPGFVIKPRVEENLMPTLLEKAYRALLEVQKCENNFVIAEIISLVRELKKNYDNK